jgi:hypothetical protein
LVGMLTEEMAHQAVLHGSAAFFEVIPHPARTHCQDREGRGSVSAALSSRIHHTPALLS